MSVRHGIEVATYLLLCFRCLYNLSSHFSSSMSFITKSLSLIVELGRYDLGNMFPKHHKLCVEMLL